MTCFFVNGNNISSSLVSAKFFLVVLTILFGFSSVTDGLGCYFQILLTYHCKSKDADLGERSLAPFGTSWKWRFYINFWDTTLYWCNFQWDENGKTRQEGFQIYKAKRDIPTCGYNCRYSIRSDGV
ncbi:hypothetical protein MKW94_008763 [Papaver nudicaule]|uniref:S-protein homolog n=1 Tax=Papaver nudicaule TaxID=74823 RepID=A0AA41VQ18_PAPNU|nr:hypothetical protein [Papaver nudicaule]